MLTYSSWIDEKIVLGRALEKGSCGGTYADAAIVLCVSIAAMSSLMWATSVRGDRRRFIEAATRSVGTKFDSTTVSAPLMAQGEGGSWSQKLGISAVARYYTGDDDKPESAVIALCDPALTPLQCRKLVRKYSYACLLYEHIRCGFIHTYSTTDAATSDDGIRATFDPSGTKITYVNYLSSRSMRKIYFPLGWIAGVAKSLASGLDAECKLQNKVLSENLNLPAPVAWWVDGA